MQGREVEWTLGFAFAEIRNPSAGAVPFPSTSQQQKDEGEEEGKGQEGKEEEEEITPVYNREVLGAVQRCPNKSRAPPPWIPMGSPSRRR